MIFYSVNIFFLIFQFQLLVTAKALLKRLSFCFYFHLPGFESQSWCLIKFYLSWDNIKPSSWPFTEMYSFANNPKGQNENRRNWSIPQNLEELQKCKNRQNLSDYANFVCGYCSAARIPKYICVHLALNSALGHNVY
jgi:hypothetical protein